MSCGLCLSLLLYMRRCACVRGVVNVFMMVGEIICFVMIVMFCCMCVRVCLFCCVSFYYCVGCVIGCLC